MDEHKIKIDSDELLEIFTSFEEEMDRKPKWKEFFSLLLLSLATNSNEEYLAESIGSLEAIKITLKSREIKLSVAKCDDYIAELNDTCFVVTSDFITLTAKNTFGQLFRKLTADTFFSSVVDAIQGMKDAQFHDIESKDINKITALYSKAKVPRAKRGDVLSVPLKDGSFALLVVLGKTWAGLASGVINTRVTTFSPTQLQEPNVLPYAIFIGNESIRNGVWKIIHHDERLVSLFREPEYYYSASSSEQAKPFGLAESSDCVLRKITKEEALEVGVDDKDFRQVLIPGDLEYYLDCKLMPLKN